MSIKIGFNLLAKGSMAVAAVGFTAMIGTLGVLSADMIVDAAGYEGILEHPLETASFGLAAFASTVFSGTLGIIGLASTYEGEPQDNNEPVHP